MAPIIATGNVSSPMPSRKRFYQPRDAGKIRKALAL